MSLSAERLLSKAAMLPAACLSSFPAIFRDVFFTLLSSLLCVCDTLKGFSVVNQVWIISVVTSE